jgi:DNA processing protein
MSVEEQKIYGLIVEDGEKDIDTLAYKSKSTPGELAAILLTLEFKGAIKSLPGKKFTALG